MWAFLISGIMAADAGAPAAPARAAQVSAVEIVFATHAGEGATGRKRFMRDGCYQIESGGSTGGAGYARGSQAGCHLLADVAAVFAKLAAVPGDGLARERTSAANAAGGARAEGLGPGGSETQVVLVRPDGSRWVGANKATQDQLLAAVNELPSENQWYAKPPEKAAGKGVQLVVLAVSTSRGGGSKRTEASLASDGRWWCNRSVIGARGGEEKLPAKKELAVKDAPARLGRIFAGMSPSAPDDPQPASSKRPDGDETSVEVVWPGQARAPLRPRAGMDAVVDRFGAEMQALSPACAVARAARPR